MEGKPIQVIKAKLRTVLAILRVGTLSYGSGDLLLHPVLLLGFTCYNCNLLTVYSIVFNTCFAC